MRFLENLINGIYKFDDITKSAGEIGSKGFEMAEYYCKSVRPSLDSKTSEIPKYFIKTIVEKFSVDGDWLFNNMNLAIAKLNYYCDNYHEKIRPFIQESMEMKSSCSSETTSSLIKIGGASLGFLSLAYILKLYKDGSVSVKGMSFASLCSVSMMSLCFGVGCELLDSTAPSLGKTVICGGLIIAGVTMWQLNKQVEHERGMEFLDRVMSSKK